MEDYRSAAVRHLADAKVLKDQGRPDNAGHLLGFAAECAIKYRIASLKPTADKPHGHLPEFLIVARKHLGPRSAYTTGMFDIIKGDIFKSWAVGRRYFVTGHTSQAELDEWFAVTTRLFASAGIKGK